MEGSAGGYLNPNKAQIILARHSLGLGIIAIWFLIS